MNGLQSTVSYDECESYTDNSNGGYQDIYVSGSSSAYLLTSSPSREGLCTGSQSFCFPSTLPGFFPKEHKLEAAGSASLSSDYGLFKLSNGRTIACSLSSSNDISDRSSLQSDSGTENIFSSCKRLLFNQTSPVKSVFLDDSLPHVEISPPLIDWGRHYLYSPSLAFLTVKNTGQNSSLHLYEPFSTSVQFYPCNFSEVFELKAGEVASLCFVFLPRWEGFSSAHLILQTSSGGFLIQVKGYGVASPYDIQPFKDLYLSTNGRRIKKLLLFNPFNEMIYLKELSAWVSVSLGNTSSFVEALCHINTFKVSNDESHMLNLKGRLEFPMMSIRLHNSWEVDSHHVETIVEIDFSSDYEVQVFGYFYLEVTKSSDDQIDTIMVPLEAEVEGKSIHDATDYVSVSFEALLPCDGSESTTVMLSLRNIGHNLLNLVNVSEIGARAKIFQIKYVKGLILFPGTVTQIAIVTYDPLTVELDDTSPELSDMDMKCKLLVQTNDSTRPRIEIPCRDIFKACLTCHLDSCIGYGPQKEKGQSGTLGTGPLGSSMLSPSQFKGIEWAEADELVLGNWKSQGTLRGMSVLDHHEVLFPIVRVGTHLSKYITIQNPCPEPIIVQLILNSAEIIDECRASDMLQPPSLKDFALNDSSRPAKYGFSIAESAFTEALIHPHGKTLFGPISFHPSKSCNWRSSALIRNNLSGVEWLTLHGVGGSLSMAIFEGSEPIQSIEFNLSFPIPLNISSSDSTSDTCSQPLSKELYAINTGDIPLEVRTISVSGTECGSDGFMVHTCGGFSLEPNESTKLQISYQTDLSTAVIHRDLELSFSTGIIVLPMKAAIPLYMLNLCKRSTFWMLLRKCFLAIFLSASLIFLVFSLILPHIIALGSHECSIKSGKSSIVIIRSEGKSPRQRTENNSKLSRTSKSFMTYPDGLGETRVHEINAQQVKSTLPIQKETNIYSSIMKEKALPSSLLSRSVPDESCALQEKSHTENLTVRVGKERGRRRRKRKGGSGGGGINGLFDVSSSQSGNSTPSSPLSPVGSITPKARAWLQSPDIDQSMEDLNPFSQRADQQCQKNQTFQPSNNCSKNCCFPVREQPCVTAGKKPVLLSSATFPCTGRPIAPHARAPGSKLCIQKTVQMEEKEGIGNEFTYDIWGDHFRGLDLIGRSKGTSGSVTESESDSFFVRGPQTFMLNTRPRSVSCFHQEG